MNDSPVKAITFEQIYRLSKQHAERFGWSKTNADIAFAASARSGTPALGDIKPEHWIELHAKWSLDLSGEGAPPTPGYDLFKEVMTRYAGRFGHDAMRRTLLRLGGQPWAPNIKHSLRRYVMDEMEREIAEDIQRARRVAGKLDAGQHIDRRKREPKSITIINTINVDDNMRATLADKKRIHQRIVDGLNPDGKSRRRRRGPINVADGIGVLRFGARIVLHDGSRGRIAACEGTEYQCLRLVVVLDDCTTRVYSGLITSEQVKRVVHDGGFIPKRFATGAWINDALRATRGH